MRARAGTTLNEFSSQGFRKDARSRDSESGSRASPLLRVIEPLSRRLCVAPRRRRLIAGASSPKANARTHRHDIG
jgi:hypothetical protein